MSDASSARRRRLTGLAALLVVAVVVVLLVLDRSGPDGPAGVVEEVVESDSCADVERDLVTTHFSEELVSDTHCMGSDFFDSGEELGDADVDIEHEVGDAEVDGDTATVEVTRTYGFAVPEQHDYVFHLVREDSTWLVDSYDEAD